MRVLEVCGNGLALCGEGVEVMTDLVGRVEPGDELLVHAGVALARLPEPARLPEAGMP
ncbi:MAG TPA: HypC/HybG/HupF family hydrogenase formation chaperone [Gaiellaceae bacterium]|jgi:hydrogenase maturation factor|nr:HypC/HybG/HupF family hydrogenase formation chaperone [Gaiellaceae bacterium]